MKTVGGRGTLSVSTLLLLGLQLSLSRTDFVTTLIQVW